MPEQHFCCDGEALTGFQTSAPLDQPLIARKKVSEQRNEGQCSGAKKETKMKRRRASAFSSEMADGTKRGVLK